MAEHSQCVWIGASGKEYTYFVWPRHPELNEGQDGNYIYAALSPENKWQPIYIGQGDLAKRATSDHHRIDCINKKGATHVHLHLNAKEADRTREEKDLLANYSQAYAPTGCNVKIGG